MASLSSEKDNVLKAIPLTSKPEPAPPLVRVRILGPTFQEIFSIVILHTKISLEDGFSSAQQKDLNGRAFGKW